MAFSTAKPIFYGWKMIVVLAITELISYGVLFYSFTIFIKPMQSELGCLRPRTQQMLVARRRDRLPH